MGFCPAFVSFTKCYAYSEINCTEMFKNLIVYCHRVIHRIPEWSFQPTVVTTVRLSSGLCVCLTVCNAGVFARIHGPYLRPVYTGAFFDPRTYGPYVWVSKRAPVYAGRIYG